MNLSRDIDDPAGIIGIREPACPTRMSRLILSCQVYEPTVTQSRKLRRRRTRVRSCERQRKRYASEETARHDATKPSTNDTRAHVRHRCVCTREGEHTSAIITSHTGYKVYKPTPGGWLLGSDGGGGARRAAGTEERDAVGSDGGGRDGGDGGRLANVEGGRNVRIITRTLWNPWHRGDGKRGRQIRTIAGVSRTALSVMVVVLFPSSSRSVPFSHPPRARAFPPSLGRLDLLAFLVPLSRAQYTKLPDLIRANFPR